MKTLDIVLLTLGVLGLAFCLYVGFANQNVPLAPMQALSAASAVTALAGYLGWRIDRRK